MDPAATWAALQDACSGISSSAPALAGPVRETVVEASLAQGIARLLGRVLQPVWLSADGVVAMAELEFSRAPDLAAIVMEDLATITDRNLESGGTAWTWLGNRGFHVMATHRLIHSLWTGGHQAMALALKAGLSPLGADIHPAVHFGRRIFLDHGVGVVMGETATIGDDVSIWHGVTLGSTLMQGGDRHPKVGPGAILGAGATVLGNISVGEGAIVAAGSMVLRPVPPFTVVAGNPAAPKAGYRHPFAFGPKRSSEVQ